MTSNLAFHQKCSPNFPWLNYLLLFCNIDFTLQLFQTFCIPIMIYQLTPYVSSKLFQFFIIWPIIITSFYFLIQFSIKLPLIILKHAVLCKPIYHFFIPSNPCCNSSNALLQFLNNNTQCFYSNIVFSF